MRNRGRSTADMALIEDLQAVLMDCLIEGGLHKEYQAAILANLPPELRSQVKAVLREDEETSRYLENRIRAALSILEEARPGPYAYDPDRPAVRIGRPLSLVKEMA